MPVARAIGVWLAGMRAAAYAWLEEVRFRTGVSVLAGLAVVVSCMTAVAVIAAQDGSPATAHRSLAGQARVAATLPVRPLRPTTSAREPRRPAPAARRNSSARRTANVNRAVSYTAASVSRPNRVRRPSRRALGRWDHLAWHDWRRHGHGPWRHGHGLWQYGHGPHRFGAHRPSREHR